MNQNLSTILESLQSKVCIPEYIKMLAKKSDLTSFQLYKILDVLNDILTAEGRKKLDDKTISPEEVKFFSDAFKNIQDFKKKIFQKEKLFLQNILKNIDSQNKIAKIETYKALQDYAEGFSNIVLDNTLRSNLNFWLQNNLNKYNVEKVFSSIKKAKDNLKPHYQNRLHSIETLLNKFSISDNIEELNQCVNELKDLNLKLKKKALALALNNSNQNLEPILDLLSPALEELMAIQAEYKREEFKKTFNEIQESNFLSSLLNFVPKISCFSNYIPIEEEKQEQLNGKIEMNRIAEASNSRFF